VPAVLFCVALSSLPWLRVIGKCRPAIKKDTGTLDEMLASFGSDGESAETESLKFSPVQLLVCANFREFLLIVLTVRTPVRLRQSEAWRLSFFLGKQLYRLITTRRHTTQPSRGGPAWLQALPWRLSTRRRTRKARLLFGVAQAAFKMLISSYATW
jgi:hypothetical protein